MVESWPKERRVIGKRTKRLDGPLKASGRAKYSYDIHAPDMLYAAFLGSPHAHAKITSIDTSKAAGMPGVKGLHPVKEAGAELVYAGDPILAIAAETEVQTYDALRAVVIEYEVLPHAVTMEASEAEGAPKVTLNDENVLKGRASKKGDFEEAFGASAAKVDRTYSMPAISHSCWESHGSVAAWDGGHLTVWCSTQATQNVERDLARAFDVPPTDVTCITKVMGGGFGSKFGAGIEGVTAAHLAKKTERPVKLMLTRREEHSAGIRPNATAHVRAGVDANGKLIAFATEQAASPGISKSARFPLPYVYEDVPNTAIDPVSVRLNQHMTRAYRAPGHPQGCFIMEAVMDDLAAGLGMDPFEMRVANLPGGLIGEIYLREFVIGAKLIDWKGKYHAPGAGTGPIRRGVGMACHKWGGRGVANEQMLVEINSDGSILVQSSTQDLGTANGTVLAIVAAEVFGLQPHQITSQIGNSDWAKSHGSGGSTTCPSTAPATWIAATEARDKLFRRLAPTFGCAPEDLIAADGRIKVKGGGPSASWKNAVRKLGMDKISVVGDFTPEIFASAGLSSTGVGGCQFAEVEVDEETGEVRVVEVVAVQDCGLIINKLACESQVAGAVVMSVNAAMLEERVMDQATGRMLNADLEFYKLGMISDMPKIKVHMFDDPISQSRGVIGIGEPPTISTAGAIGNALFNALGVRVPHAPFTPRNVLAALSAARGGVA